MQFMNETLALLTPQQSGSGLISEQTRELLRATLVGQSKPGERLPSERELARQLGVSTTTVSRALQELQQEGILRRMPGKGTFMSEVPTKAAASVRPAGAWSPEGQTNGAAPWEWHGLNGRNGAHSQPPIAAYTAILAKLGSAPETLLSTEYWAHRATSAIERFAQQSGGRTLITNREEQNSPQQIAAVFDDLRAAGVNSLIFVGDFQSEADEMWGHHLLRFQSRQEQPRAVTQILPSSAAQWPFDAVRFNGEHGSFLATSHLLEQGHRHLAFLCPAFKTSWLEERIRGFRRAIASWRAEGTEIEPQIISAAPGTEQEPNFWEVCGANIAAKVRADPSLTAVVVANDDMARGLIETLNAAGHRIPDALSVVGYDDRFGSNALGLTTLHVPIEQMGETAAALCQRRLAQPWHEGHIEVVLNPSLVFRSSTRVAGS